MNKTLTITEPTRQIKKVVLDTVDSPETKRAYDRALSDFMAWYESSGRGQLNKAAVQAYKTGLQNEGMSAASINQRLSAIRKLAIEAADNQALDPQIAAGIQRVNGIRKEGKKLGNWLNKRQAEQLINAPDINTIKGLRDRAILTILIGCGLRRDEASRLTIEQIQQREGRWVIVDLVGKRNKTRSVPMPSWAKASIDAWTQAAGITGGNIFRHVNKGDNLAGDSISDQAVFNIVKTYADPLGLDIAPHDLRRTYAKLAHKGGAALEQIQISLGHASIKTTEIYLGVQQSLTNAPCDHINLNIAM